MANESGKNTAAFAVLLTILRLLVIYLTTTLFIIEKITQDIL